MIISDLPSSNNLASPDALRSSQVGMVSYRQNWSLLQPTEPLGGITNNPGDASWQWGFFDSALAQATAAGVLCFFRVLVQASNSPSWVRTQSQQFITSSGASVNVYWDTFYQSAVTALIQAMASRYAANPIVKIFALNIAADHSGDWGVPHGENDWNISANAPCPAFGASVNVVPQPNQTVFLNSLVFINTFGWFQITGFTGPNTNPTSVTLLNLGYSGNANSGTIGAAKVMQVSDVANLQSPMYNYTTTRFETAIDDLIVAVKNAWTGQVYSHEVGRNGKLDPFPGATTFSYNAATQMGQYGYANVTTGKFALAKNTLSAQNPLPAVALAAQDGSDLYLPAQTLAGSTNTSGTTGTIPAGSAFNGQFIWQAYDPTGLYLPSTTGPTGHPYYANAGVPFSNPVPIFQYIVALARAYGAQVLETYEQDVINVLPTLGDLSTAGSFVTPYQLRGAYCGQIG
jgi:hypothetical protein